MPNNSLPVTNPPRGCLNCRCHAYNALLALACWDLDRALRRKNSN